MEGSNYSTGLGSEGDPKDMRIDEVPPLHIKAGAEAGIRIEELFQQRHERRMQELRKLRAEGIIEADTEEMEIIAEAGNPAIDPSERPPLNRSQQLAADRLAEREMDKRKQDRVRDILRKYPARH